MLARVNYAYQIQHLFKHSLRFYSTYDAIIIGGGHNGLTCAAYLAKSQKRVLVLEKRHLLGGAAVTEEVIPGFKFSRASYVCSLLRPSVIKELELNKFGLKMLPRNPYSLIPTRDGRYLMLSSDKESNVKEIGKFSKEDAENFIKYEEMLRKLVDALDPLLDSPPIDFTQTSIRHLISQYPRYRLLTKQLYKLGRDVLTFLELLVAPADKILNRWFVSEPLKALLATDSIVGAFASPSMPGSAYVLLHHVMGGQEWSFVKGGMGGISQAIALAAQSFGAEICTNRNVKRVIVKDGIAVGVVLENGEKYYAKKVISNCDPYTTFVKLVPEGILSDEFRKKVEQIDFSSGVFKINLAVDRLPNFTAKPNIGTAPNPHHAASIFFVQSMDEIEQAFRQAAQGEPSSRPVMEMVIPTSLDDSIGKKSLAAATHKKAPKGKHIVQLFCQYAPYKLANGSWDDPGKKEAFANSCYKVIEEFAPGFTESIVGADLLSPLDLERIFGLQGGNIFHGAMRFDQLYSWRGAGCSSYKTPVKNLFMCGAGCHPGGGVMGSAGRNCAIEVLKSGKM